MLSGPRKMVTKTKSSYTSHLLSIFILVALPPLSPPLRDHDSVHLPSRSLSCSSSVSYSSSVLHSFSVSHSSSVLHSSSISHSSSQAPRTPSSRHGSTLSSPSKAFVSPHTLQEHARIPPRYKPYQPQDGPTPLELWFAARTTGPSSHLSMTVEDVEEVNMAPNSMHRPLLTI